MIRRDFIKYSSLSLPLLMFAPGIQAQGVQGGKGKILVLVELKGGNDGLNTVVPYADPHYKKLRPQIHLNADQVLKLNEQTGLHPSLKTIKGLWDDKDAAIVQGVGYTNPNRSHFRSIEIWETATKSNEFSSEGWLTQALEGQPQGDKIIDGVVVGDLDAGPLRGGKRALSVQNPAQLIRTSRRLLKPSATLKSKNPALAHMLQTQDELLKATHDIESKLLKKGSKKLKTKFPQTRIGKQLAVAAQFIANDVPLWVIRVTHGSFDTHAGQINRHRNLLAQLDTALGAFTKEMKGQGKWNDVLVMTYSEFGRRAAQNGSRGTDHGTAAPHFLLGGGVRGGLFGKQPSLTDLQGGDLKHHVDFKRLYATAMHSWLGLRPNGALKGHKAMPLIG